MSSDLDRAPVIRENARAHAAARAWKQLGADRDPFEIKVLKERPTQRVYWLAGAGPAGVPVIAKQENRSKVDLEHKIYTEILPRLPLPSLQYHGVVDAGGSLSWTFFEFSSGREYSKTHDDDRRLAGGWLGLLHAAAPEVPGVDQLADRGPGYFFGRLVVARNAMVAQLERAAQADVVLLEDIIRALEELETRWDEVHELCDTCPYTLVHGDFGRKNIRVRSGPHRAHLDVFDWGESGWGPSLVDLTPANPCLDAYRRGFSARDAAPPTETLKRFAAVAKVVRLVRVIEWEARRSGPAYFGKDWLLAYLERMREGMREAGWSHRHGGVAKGRPKGVAAAARTESTEFLELEEPISNALDARSVRILTHERLKGNVHRLRAEVDGIARLLVAKRSQAEVARRNWLVACRWLPAAHLDGLGPPILGVAADPDAQSAWHVYEDLSGEPLSRRDAPESDVWAVLETIARVHVGFAGHPLLRECRLWGGDRGIAFYSGNVSDAISALRAFEPRPGAAEYRDALLGRMEGLRAHEGRRREILNACGGTETLLHGDLWTTNAILVRSGREVDVRLVDWDEAAVGPPVFDLSTFVLQFDRRRRPTVLRRYRQIVRRLAGWELADDRRLNVAFAAVAYARLASMLVWTLAAADDGDGAWLPGRLGEIVRWLDDVEPVLPA